MSPHARRRASGFSLVELLVALVIGAFAIAGALALMIGQQRIFQRSSGDRAVQETARVALEELSGNLRLAGYGLEPHVTFDFGRLDNVVLDRLPVGSVARVPGYACPAAVACRDATAGAGTPDEIVFHYRNPYFMRPLAVAPGVGAVSLTIAGPLPAPLRRGQILQVVCYSGSMYWAFVTVGAEVAATNAAAVNVPLEGGAGFDFGLQNQVLGDSCFQAVAPAGSPAVTVASAAKVFKVERFRYFVQTYDPGGNVVAWGSAGARPHLMLDQGLQVDGRPLLQLVAPDVEDLQLSYVFPRAAAGAQLAGATVGVALQNAATGIDLAAGGPAYSDRVTAATRTNHHPANIGAVRVALVVRTPEADLSPAGVGDTIVPEAGNRAAVAGPAGYRRQRYETSVATPNLDVRAPFFPVYSTGAGDRLNVNGG